MGSGLVLLLHGRTPPLHTFAGWKICGRQDTKSHFSSFNLRLTNSLVYIFLIRGCIFLIFSRVLSVFV